MDSGSKIGSCRVRLVEGLKVFFFRVWRQVQKWWENPLPVDGLPLAHGCGSYKKGCRIFQPQTSSLDFWTADFFTMKFQARTWGWNILSKISFHWLESESFHTIYTRNNMGQKCEGDCGLWVLNEILKKTYPENLKKIVGSVWEIPAK